MKKMLSTTLVAVAFAMVSTVDAKVMAKKSMPTTSQKINNIAMAAADLVESPAEVQMPAMTNTQNALSAQNLTADEREYAVLEFQLLDTNNRIAFRTEQLKGLKLGMFGGLFTATKEQKEESNRLINIINKLKADKRQIESDMAALRPVVGDKFTKAVKLFALGVVTTVVTSTAYAIDQKYFEGKYSTYASDKIGQGAEYVRTSRVGQATGNAWESTKATASNAKAAAVNKYNAYMGK